MLGSLRLLNALMVRIRLEPKAYCSVLDIAGQDPVSLGLASVVSPER